MRSHLVSAAARRRPVLAALAALALASSAVPALATAPQVEGQWSEVVPWPRIAIHAALLPDGKVLTFGATPQGNQGGFDIDIWDPALGLGDNAHNTMPNGINVDTFCAAVLLQPWNGEIMIAGGGTNDQSMTRKGARFSFKSKALTQIESTQYQRWYGTLTTLPDGRLLMKGGGPAYANNTNSSDVDELYTPGQGWRTLTGTAFARNRNGGAEERWWYPRVWPIAGGKVFTITGKTMYQTAYGGNGANSNFQTFGGQNWGSTSTAVMYAPNRILQAGGGAALPDVNSVAGSRAASTIDISAFPYRVTNIAPMAFGRHWATSTVLPNGEVLVTGGSESNNGAGYNADTVAYAAEIWNPGTGRWRTGAASRVPRLYHSVALLLADGRVLTAGGGAPGPVDGRNAQVYSPPYLFAADGTPAARPAIATEPGTVRLGQTMTLTASGPRPITRFTMVKTGAVTHSFNNDQRFLDVPFQRSGDTYRLTVTANAVDATPGYYLLFALDEAGVPSVAKMMRIPSPTADNGDVPPAGQTGETAGVGAAGNDSGGGGTGGGTPVAGGGNPGGDGNGGGGTGATPAAGTSAPLVAAHSDMCLSVEVGSAADGARVVQETCNGSALQTWSWRAGNGGSMLVNAQTNKCLDVFNGRTEDGATLVQWPCWGGDMQVWRPAATAEGLTLTSKISGKCLDVSAVSMQSGAQVFQWACNGQGNQAWKLPAAPAPTPTDNGAVAGTAIGVEAAKVASAVDGTTLVVNRTTGVVWRYNADNNWTALGTRAMREVATGGAGRIYAIGTDGNAYRWNNADWVMIGPNARTIAAASDGTVVVTNPANEIWLKTADDFGGNWRRLGGAAAKVVAVAANRFWSVGVDGNVYRSGGNGAWAQAGVNVSDIAAASDGGIAVINKDTGETWRKADEDAPWTRAGGRATQIAAQRSNLWITIGQTNAVSRVQAN